MSLQGKVVVITGASRGIGRALALGFAGEGATVVAAARTQRPDTGTAEGSLEETVRDIVAAGGRAVPVQCDVADENDVKSLVERALSEAGPIDVLINNAGFMLAGLITEIETEQWDHAMAVNVRGPFLTCKYILPGMMDRRQGNVINITSRSANRDDSRRLPYGASKAALERFTLNLAVDMKPYNIAVNALGPGLIASRPTRTEPARQDPLGRTPDAPVTVIPAALWVAQQDASAFTGRIVHRDEFGKTWP